MEEGKQKKWYIVYVDATCQGWNTVVDGVCEGELYVKLPRKIIREKKILKDRLLKQFINRFELLAIKKGLEECRNKQNFIIYSDSKVAIAWAKDPHVQWIPREENKAGFILDKNRLEKM